MRVGARIDLDFFIEMDDDETEGDAHSIIEEMLESHFSWNFRNNEYEITIYKPVEINENEIPKKRVEVIRK